MTELSFYLIAVVGTIAGFGLGYLLGSIDDDGDDYNDPDGE